MLLLEVEDVDSMLKGVSTESQDKVLNQLWRAICSCHHGRFHVEYVEDISYHDLNS